MTKFIQDFFFFNIKNDNTEGEKIFSTNEPIKKRNYVRQKTIAWPFLHVRHITIIKTVGGGTFWREKIDFGGGKGVRKSGGGGRTYGQQNVPL